MKSHATHTSELGRHVDAASKRARRLHGRSHRRRTHRRNQAGRIGGPPRLNSRSRQQDKGPDMVRPCGDWWRRGGSNSRPSHCERDALPAELRPRTEARILAAARWPPMRVRRAAVNSRALARCRRLENADDRATTPPGSTRSTTTAPASRSIRRSSSAGPRPRRWRASRRRGALDVRYGDGPNETLDVFPAAAAPTRRCWCSSTAATGARSTSRDHLVRRAVVRRTTARWWWCPNYALCPAVTIETIALQMARALAWTWRNAGAVRRRPEPHRRRRAIRPAATWPRCCCAATGRRWRDDLPPQLVRRRAVDLGPVRPRADPPHAVPAGRPAADAGVGAAAEPGLLSARRARHAVRRGRRATRATSSCARTS